jgi:two-component system LytT family response regulator
VAGDSNLVSDAASGNVSNPKLRALLVDDEALARSLLKELLASVPEVEVVGEAANGFEAVKLAGELAPDLLFLDIQMPKLSGFEVLELLGEAAPVVIFVTAYDEYALKAFEVHAVDYLMKPVDPERLAEAVERAARRRLGETQGGLAPAPKAAELAARLHQDAQPPGRTLARVLFREEGKIHVLPVEKIDFVEAQDDYLSFASAGKRYRKQQTLGELEAQLDGARFVRVHRSYLLNVERLARLDLYAKDSWIAILADGAKIPVSRSGHQRLRELLG